MRTLRRIPEADADAFLSEKSPWFRGFLVWITFLPMALLTFQQPVYLVIVERCAAFLMPFMAGTLRWLLNCRVAPA